MSFAMRFSRRLVLPLLALCLLGAAPVNSNTFVAKANSNVQTASMLPEVRLRKVHLVRPDLIPYPIAYEIYC